MNCYRVGGAVRDILLEFPHHETDWVVVGSTVEEMLTAGFQQVGRDFPVFLHPDTKEEFALARTERKSGHGYRGFIVHADPSVTGRGPGKTGPHRQCHGDDEDGEIIDCGVSGI